MLYLLNAIKVQWLPFLAFFVDTATAKNSQNNDICVPAATKKDLMHQSVCCKHIEPSASQ